MDFPKSSTDENKWMGAMALMELAAMRTVPNSTETNEYVQL